MKLAIFIPDTADFTKSIPIGHGEAVFLHYRIRRGFLGARRARRRLLREARGAYTFDTAFSEQLSLPIPAGDAARLVHTVWDRLLPEDITLLSLAPGEGYLPETVLRAARKVRFLELLGDASLSPLADFLEAETGMVVPIVAAPHTAEGALSVYLPGSRGGAGLDLTQPDRTLSFLPPPTLRSLTPHTGTSARTIAALLSFFDIPYADVDVFCKKL